MSTNETACSFTYSVYDRFELKETNNIMVIGHVTGTIKKGCEICAINPGDDVKKQVVTEVLGLEVGDGKGGYSQVMELTDGMVGVMLKDCSNENIKPGTVLYSKDSDNEAIHSAYIKGIGDITENNCDIKLTDKKNINKLIRLNLSWFNKVQLAPCVTWETATPADCFQFAE